MAWIVPPPSNRGAISPLDVDETLSTFMVNDLPDPVRFFRVVGDLIAAAARATAGEAATGCTLRGMRVYLVGARSMRMRRFRWSNFGTN